jgi:hypothetical protein
MTSFTRGPLPARVYWTRRLLLVALALLLVVGIARLLSLGSDGSSPPAKAAEVAAATTPTPSAGTPTPSAGPTTAGLPSAGAPGAVRRPGRGGASQPPLAEPQGACTDEDVAVSPEVKQAVAGPQGAVRIALHLSTLQSEACTWHVSPGTLALKITSGSDAIWSSRQCPAAVPATDVVVRRAVTTTVDVAWNGRRADHGCGKLSDWALPGTYHVTAAALAGEPTEAQFSLEAPKPRVITVAPTPTQDPSPSRGRAASASPSPSAPASGH